jgi:hypothetical protein
MPLIDVISRQAVGRSDQPAGLFHADGPGRCRAARHEGRGFRLRRCHGRARGGSPLPSSSPRFRRTVRSPRRPSSGPSTVALNIFGPGGTLAPSWFPATPRGPLVSQKDGPLRRIIASRRPNHRSTPTCRCRYGIERPCALRVPLGRHVLRGAAPHNNGRGHA